MDYTDTHWGPRSKGNARCTECGRTRQEAIDLDVHHRDYDRGESNPDVFGHVCRRCHFLTKHGRDGDAVRDQSAFDPKQPTGLGPKRPSAASLGP